jgi:hypothetical protein
VNSSMSVLMLFQLPAWSESLYGGGRPTRNEKDYSYAQFCEQVGIGGSCAKSYFMNINNA